MSERMLPDGWRWARLQDIGRFDSGGTPSKSVEGYWNGHIPFVTGADITQFYITSGNARAFLTDEGLASGKTAICEPGTVLFVTRTRVGRIGIATELMAASQDLSPYHCGVNVIPEFACWYLLNLPDYLLANCRGSTILGLTRDFIHSIEIPLPPLDEQRRIAAILDEQMVAVEQARAAAEAQLAAAEQLTSAYLQQAFESMEAQEWGTRYIGDIAHVAGGIQKQPNRKPVQFHRPYLTVRNVQRGWLDLTHVEEFEITPNEFERCRLLEGDILIVEGNGSLDQIGRNALFRGEIEECIHQNHVIRVRLNRSVALPDFVSLYLNSNSGKQQMVEKAFTTSGLYTLSVSKVSSLEVVLPPMDIQVTVAETTKSYVDAANKMRSGLEAQLGLINQLPATLLRQAFSGEL